jgi:hypothetical protein
VSSQYIASQAIDAANIDPVATMFLYLILVEPSIDVPRHIDREMTTKRASMEALFV